MAAIKLIDPFTNIELREITPASDTEGAVYLSDLRSVNIGDGGDNTFRADNSGIWLGAETYANAPFKVSMSGALTASSILITGGSISIGTNAWHVDVNGNMWWGDFSTYAAAAIKISAAGVAYFTGAVISGYVAVGGSAADVNAGSTTISGGKITANSITADRIVAGALVVGTNVGLGTAQTASQVTTIIGNTVTTGFVNALSVTAGSVAAENITGNTITGKTIKTASTGSQRVEMNAAGDYIHQIAWFNSSDTLQGLIKINTVPSPDRVSIQSGAGATDMEFIASNVYVAGAFLPYVSTTYDLGSSSYKWNDLYVGGAGIFSGTFRLPVLSGDPSGEPDGSMYYNSTTKRTKVRQNGSFVNIWTD